VSMRARTYVSAVIIYAIFATLKPIVVMLRLQCKSNSLPTQDEPEGQV
jgi:hypothetical protein